MYTYFMHNNNVYGIIYKLGHKPYSIRKVIYIHYNVTNVSDLIVGNFKICFAIFVAATKKVEKSAEYNISSHIFILVMSKQITSWIQEQDINIETWPEAFIF